MKTEVLVIGAGAAGMMAAARAAGDVADTILLERNEKVGRKIGITGKGRCNVTNCCDSRAFMNKVVTNGKFLYSALKELDPEGMMKLLESCGVPLKVERGQRVFTASDRSFDIIVGLLRYVKKQGGRLVTGTTVRNRSVLKDGSFSVKTDKGTYEAPCVILCTGGVSYPVTGSDGTGHMLARELGLEVTDLRPGLIPFTIREEWCREMMGLSLKNVKVSIRDASQTKPKKQLVYEDTGEMLFTHFGVSGPLILSASSVLQSLNRKNQRDYADGSYTLHIDLKPGLDEEQLDRRLLEDMDKYKARDFRHSLDDLLPRTMIPVVVRLSRIDPLKKAGDLTKEERKRLGALLKDFAMTITGTRPVEEAIVTMGGVSVKEMDPSTMMVKMIPGLFMAGELLDLDAFTGGFNLQIAFSPGHLAGKGAAEYINKYR
mgnify:CR=1 FL=1